MKRILLSVLATVAILALVACGGGSSNTTRTSNPSSAAVSINVGDATADRLLSFEVTVSSVTLTGSSARRPTCCPLRPRSSSRTCPANSSHCA